AVADRVDGQGERADGQVAEGVGAVLAGAAAGEQVAGGVGGHQGGAADAGSVGAADRDGQPAAFGEQDVVPDAALARGDRRGLRLAAVGGDDQYVRARARD